MRTTLLVIHILAASAWFGTNVVQLTLNPRLMDQPREAASWWLRQTAMFARAIYAPAAVILLITGVWMVLIIDGIGFDAAFVSIGFLVVIAGAALGSTFFGPRARKAADAIEAGDTDGAKATIAAIRPVAALDMLILIVAFVAMVNRWGL